MVCISEQKLQTNQWKKNVILLHISNMGFNVKILQGSEIFVYKTITAVNHWCSQTELNKHCFDGLGTSELISEQKLQPNQWKKIVILLHISHWGQNGKILQGSEIYVYKKLLYSIIDFLKYHKSNFVLMG